MPYRETQIKKKYWTIGQLAELLNINTSNIRYWEQQFPWIMPKKRFKNDRRYTHDDIQKVLQINALVNGIGMTIDGIKKAHQYGQLDDLSLLLKTRRFTEVKYGYADKEYPMTPDECFFGIN